MYLHGVHCNNTGIRNVLWCYQYTCTKNEKKNDISCYSACHAGQTCDINELWFNLDVTSPSPVTHVVL